MIAALLHAIILADLPLATERVAIRLLDRTDTTATLHLPWSTYETLCTCTTNTSARRHLTRLQNANLLTYTARSTLYVDWMIPPGIIDDPPKDHTVDISRTAPSLCRQDDPPKDHRRSPQGSSSRHNPTWTRPRFLDDPPRDHPVDISRAVQGSSSEHNPNHDPPRDHRRSPQGSSSQHKPTASHTRDLDRLDSIDSSSISINLSTIYTDQQKQKLQQIGIDPDTTPHAPNMTESTIDTIIDGWLTEYEAGAKVTSGALLYRLKNGWSSYAQPKPPPPAQPIPEIIPRQDQPPDHNHIPEVFAHLTKFDLKRMAFRFQDTTKTVVISTPYNVEYATNRLNHAFSFALNSSPKYHDYSIQFSTQS